MRPPLSHDLGRRELDPLQQLVYAVLSLPMQLQRPGQVMLDRVIGIQRGERILEDRLPNGDSRASLSVVPAA